MAKSIIRPEFYATFPSYGKKISFQWDELRKDLNVLNALAKAEYIEQDDTTDLARSRLSGLAFGQHSNSQEFRWFFDKADNLLKLQRNTGTEASPIWVTISSFNGSGGAIGKVQERGGTGTPDVFYFPHTLYVQRPDLTVEDNGDGQPVLQYNSQFRIDESGTGANADVQNATRLKVAIGTGLQVIQESTGVARLEFTDVGALSSFYFQTPAREWVVNHNFSTSHLHWNVYDTKFRAVMSYDPLRTPRNNLLEVDVSNQNVAYFYFFNPQSGYATLSGGGIAQVVATTRGSFYIAESEVGGFNANTSTLKVDSAAFYLTSGGDGVPLLSIRDDAFDSRYATLEDLPPGFYGITVAETDDSPAFKNVNTLKFDRESFYVEQNFPNTDEAIVSFRGNVNAQNNTASNLGAGNGVFAQKIGEDLQFKSLVAAGNVTITANATEIQIDASGSGGGGGFYGVIFKDGTHTFRDDTIRFNPNEFYLTSEGDKPQLNLLGGLVGEANTASNLGAGEGIFAQKSGVDLQFKSLVAGSGITLTPTANDITIEASGGSGGGFYGIIFKESTAGSAGGTGGTTMRDDTLVFDSTYFYLMSEGNNEKPLLSMRLYPQKIVTTFSASLEVQIPTDSLTAPKDVVWSVWDNKFRALIPQDVYLGADSSNVPTAFFYFAASTTGRIILIGVSET